MVYTNIEVNRMKKILVKNQVEGGQVAFDLLKESLAAGAQTLGLATGSSPIALYQEMVESDVDFSELYSVNLDEYVGLAPDHEQSYHAFMKAQLFDAKPFKESFLPDGMAEDLEQAAKDYDEVLAHHAIDLQILGIGSNGHIGFNEPGTPFDSQTHVVDLTDSTIEANSRFFASRDQVPTKAISMGIASIMAAKKIILFAYGDKKADAIFKMVKGPVTEEVPASVLQNHPDVTLILDEAAAAKL